MDTEGLLYVASFVVVAVLGIASGQPVKAGVGQALFHFTMIGLVSARFRRRFAKSQLAGSGPWIAGVWWFTCLSFSFLVTQQTSETMGSLVLLGEIIHWGQNLALLAYNSIEWRDAWLAEHEVNLHHTASGWGLVLIPLAMILVSAVVCIAGLWDPCAWPIALGALVVVALVSMLGFTAPMVPLTLSGVLSTYCILVVAGARCELALGYAEFIMASMLTPIGIIGSVSPKSYGRVVAFSGVRGRFNMKVLINILLLFASLSLASSWVWPTLSPGWRAFLSSMRLLMVLIASIVTWGILRATQ